MYTRKLITVAVLGTVLVTMVANLREEASGDGRERDGRERDDRDGHGRDGHGRNRKVAYEISITNITRGQIFSPAAVAIHNSQMMPLFRLGEPASEELSQVAEDAVLDPLVDKLGGSPNVEVVTVLTGENGPILPGETATIEIEASRRASKISLVGMMVSTNDAFYALDRASLPRFRGTTSMRLVGYDAGSEANNELCSHIPGPPCGNPGVRATDDAEGYVHVHAGIHGIGDLDASELDWRNPVAQVTIRRVSR